jgi:hypothetical protein
MFKFLFGRKRGKPFSVFYTVGDGSFVLKATVHAVDEYSANRYFDRVCDVDYHRLPNATVAQ